jgi:general secretion pathway protein M
MTDSLRSVFSKVFAVAILIALGLGVVTLLVRPIAGQRTDLDDRIVTQRTLLGRLISAENAAAKAVSGVEPDAALNGTVFLEGESDAIRLADLQSRLSEAAQSIGARLSSTQPVPPRDDLGVRLIGVQTQLSTTIEQLQKMLFELESAKPLLIIQAVNVSRGPDRDGEEVTELDVRLTVLGATPRAKDGP